MIEKIKTVLLVIICAAICMGAAVTSSPYTGAGWNTAAPNDEAIGGNAYLEMQDLRKGVGLRMIKEHEAFASSSAGGVHKQGSARAFFQDDAPGTQVDGSAFDSNDLGSFWFDSNSTPDNQFNVLTATTPTWTPISTEVIAVLLASNRTFAGTLTVTGESTFNNHVNLGAGDDLIGSATSDITINTNKFTVAGATGNTVVAGTLGVTGASTFTAGITANGGVTLGAGDDLIGSATSDITINTNKFTVAGDTGNTVVAGTLAITGASTFTGGGCYVYSGAALAGGAAIDVPTAGTYVTVATGLSNRALCYIKVMCSAGGGGQAVITVRDEDETTDWGHERYSDAGGAARVFLADNEYGAVTVPCDAAGNIEITSDTNGDDWKLWLMGYIQ